TIKEDVSKSLEIARNDKLIGNSLEAEITLFSTGKLYTFTRDLEDQLEHILIVSKVNLIEGAPQDEAYQSLNFEELHIKVGKFDGKKCPRCWIYHNNKEDLCERCVRVMKDLTHTS
ncbi:MAG: isoleucine--tRNA ligase, partial [Clostridiales bacterium]|nr:isoleucine--tRNA ligase [Clostridiales bacterium]